MSESLPPTEFLSTAIANQRFHNFDSTIRYHMDRMNLSHLMSVNCAKRLANERLDPEEAFQETRSFVFHLTQTNLHAHYINKITNHLIADLALGTNQR